MLNEYKVENTHNYMSVLASWIRRRVLVQYMLHDDITSLCKTLRTWVNLRLIRLKIDHLIFVSPVASKGRNYSKRCLYNTKYRKLLYKSY